MEQSQVVRQGSVDRLARRLTSLTYIIQHHPYLNLVYLNVFLVLLLTIVINNWSRRVKWEKVQGVRVGDGNN
jgi:hypothetical protein